MNGSFNPYYPFHRNLIPYKTVLKCLCDSSIFVRVFDPHTKMNIFRAIALNFFGVWESQRSASKFASGSYRPQM